MFLEQQITMLEWFLKDHVSLKTGAKIDETSALPSITNYILNIKLILLT